MPRINIYIPDDLDLAIRSFPGELNVSRVCAAALRAQIAGERKARVAGSMFFSLYNRPDSVSRSLMKQFPGLLWAYAADPFLDHETVSDVVAEHTAYFLDETLFEGCVLGIGGGKQMWEMVRRLELRNLGIDLWALGFGHVDAEEPHVHANALVTVLSMLYAPRTKAHLVGAEHLDWAWHFATLLPKGNHEVKRYLIGSCSMFDADSPYARLLGKEMTDFLVEERVMGDFLGVFITPDGRLVEPYAKSMTVSHVPSTDLRELAKRDDTFVILSAAGMDKLRLIRAVLQAGLCNVLFTDGETAEELVAPGSTKVDQTG